MPQVTRGTSWLNFLAASSLCSLILSGHLCCALSLHSVRLSLWVWLDHAFLLVVFLFFFTTEKGVMRTAKQMGHPGPKLSNRLGVGRLADATPSQNQSAYNAYF